MLKLKFQIFGCLMQIADSLEKSYCWEGEEGGQKEEKTSKDEKAGWHHRCNGHKLGQTLGDGEGQRGLACCSPWDCKESDTTEQLNNITILKSNYPLLKK